MDEPFHPSTLSEILDQTAQLYRARFLVFLGIAFIPTAALLVPVVAVFLFVAWTETHPGDAAVGVVGVLGMIALGLVAMPLFVGVSALASAAMSHAASRAVLGQATTIRDAYKAVWPRGWRYIGLYLIEILAVWVAPFAVWTVLVLLSAALSALAKSAGIGGGGFLALLIFVIVAGLIAYGVWMSLRLSLAFPACVIEQCGVFAAFKRSSTLSKGTKRRIVLLYLLMMALATILSFAIMVPLIVGLSLLPAAKSPEHAQAIGTAAVFILYGSRFAVQAFTRPVSGIALMLFYYDQRIRQEAFDIEWMMLKAGLIVPPPPPPEPVSWLPPSSATENAPLPEAAQFAVAESPATFAESPVALTGSPVALHVETASESAIADQPLLPNSPAD